MDIKVSEIKVISNVRKTFDEAALKELAMSIKEVGLIQPIVVTKVGEKYHLVAGERRLRAVRDILKNETINAEVVEGTPELLLEIQLVENLQREDVPPMQEAEGFVSLFENKKRAMTASEIANRVGKSVLYVARRLKIKNLLPAIRKDFDKGKVTFDTALELCVLDQKLQKAFRSDHWAYESSNPGAVKSWLARYAHNNLSSATFKLNDKTIYPEAGSCNDCEKRSSKNELFSDDKVDRCLDPECFQKKTKLAMKQRIKALTTEYGEVALVNNYNEAKKTEFGMTTDKDFYEVTKDTEGAIPAINIDRDLGKVHFIKYGRKREQKSDQSKVDPKVTYEKRMENINRAINRDVVRHGIARIYNGIYTPEMNERELTKLVVLRAMKDLGGIPQQLLEKCIEGISKEKAKHSLKGNYDYVSVSNTLMNKYDAENDKLKSRLTLASLILFLRQEFDGNPDKLAADKYKALFTSIYGKQAYDELKDNVMDLYKAKIEAAKRILKPKDKKKGKKK